MTIYETMEQYPTHESCIDFLEGVRFKDGAYCPHCGSVKVAKKSEKRNPKEYESGLVIREKRLTGRWNCHDCKSSFNVLSGTIFQGTKIQLQKWFVAITIIMNAKKSLSSYQLSRDIGISQDSALYLMQRVRAEMASEDKSLLQGIIEADETYVGGKPRKKNKRSGDDTEDKPKRGRGTKKTPIIGVIERGGKVKAEVTKDLTGKGVLEFVKGNINPDDSVLMTDEYRAYNTVDSIIKHEVIKHKEQYADGEIHTNTIEGFWSLLKRAWYGQHHHYSKGFMPLYIAEACYKYNHRGTENMLDTFLRGCFG